MTPFAIVLLLSGAIASIQILRLVRRWQRGRPAPADWRKGIAALPAAYLGPVHAVVARDPVSARMHVLAAGGFLAALFLSLPLHLGAPGRHALAVGVLIAGGAAIAGAGLAARRRVYRDRQHSLSAGQWKSFAVVLSCAVTGLISAAMAVLLQPVPTGIWATILVVGLVGLGWLAIGILGGPMRHAVAGAIHLAAHPRHERLAGVRSTALVPLDLDDEQAPLGTGAVKDLAWNRLASHDACVQCGRCEAVCPAFAAGQPLNPKALIADLVHAAGHDTPYSGNGHPGHPHAPIVLSPDQPVHLSDATVWSCTTCRACVEECPMLIEHVDAIVGLRRHRALATGRLPEKVARTLLELRQSDTATGLPAETRNDWAVDLNLRHISETGSADVLLWLGEAAFDLRGRRALRSLVALLRAARVDFAVLGADERDCGDTARRLGDEEGFQRLARKNIAELKRWHFGCIVTADPHAFQTLSQEYPAFGGDFTVLHHTTFLDRLFTQKQLSLPDTCLGDLPATITYHDPCYLGRYAGETQAPRSLLDRLGIERREMELHGLRAQCCGGGGGAPIVDIPGKRRIPDMRMEQARSTGAEAVAVACPNCRTMLEGVAGPRPVVLDVAELLARRLGLAT